MRRPSQQQWFVGFLLLVLVLFIGSFLKLSFWTTPEPASGGDTGSHFFPLEVLVRTGSLRNWNPGNLMGEPQLVHYFPFVFWFMAALAKVMPVGMAFNWGQLLGLFFLPLAVFQGLRWLGYRPMRSFFCALMSLVFFFNESYSAWGGNFASTLAGQFSHLYALGFLFLVAGSLRRELKAGRAPIASTLLMSCLMLCHSYVFIGVPAFFASIHLSLPGVPLRKKLLHFGGASLATALLTAFWWLPMIENSPWQTAYGSAWLPNVRFMEYLPWVFWPYLLSLALIPFAGRLSLRLGRAWRLRGLRFELLFWGIPSAFYLAMVFVFPKVGLVDIRAIPQIQLFAMVMVGLWLSQIVHSLGGVRRVLGGLAVVAVVLLQIQLTTRKVPSWLKWNYEGWNSKTLAPAARQLYSQLRGNFDQPRVVYEHSGINNGAGTPRVFEMLPHFTGRATLESLYMQATILAPYAYYMQALVSDAPSCPFPNFPCPRANLKRALELFPLLGARDLILVTEKVKSQTGALASQLEARLSSGPWTLYGYRPAAEEDTSYVMGLTEPPEVLRADRSVDFKARFFNWFESYRPGQERWLVRPGVDSGLDLEAITPDQWALPRDCRPELRVALNELRLRTSCPGHAHILKFAYNPGLVSLSGEPLFLASPGYIGVIPSSNELVIRFGGKTSWRWADRISAACAMVFVLFAVLLGFRRTGRLTRAP